MHKTGVFFDLNFGELGHTFRAKNGSEFTLYNSKAMDLEFQKGRITGRNEGFQSGLMIGGILAVGGILLGGYALNKYLKNKEEED